MTRSRSKLVGAVLAITAGWLLFVWLGRSTASEEATTTNAAAQVPTTELVSPDLAESGRTRDAVATSAAPREQPIARLEIREAGAAPVADAEVLACRGEELVWRKSTDANGRIETAADGTELLLVVTAAGYPLIAESLALTPGEHVLELPTGERVAGAVFATDGTPMPRLELLLDSDHPLPPREAIPEVAWHALGIQPLDRLRVATRTESDGSFEFRGLPVPWRGTLRCWHVIRITSASAGAISTASRDLTLERAVDDLRIVVVPSPVLRGRALDASTRAPVATLTLRAGFAYRELDFEGELILTTDDGGRFERSLDRDDVVRIDLALGGTAAATRFLRLVEKEIPSDYDLGEVLVPPTRDVHFTLHDPLGKPIAAGVATIAGVKSAPTDREGRSVVPHVSPLERELRIVADGFLPETVELPELLPDPLALVLTAANRLDVQVTAPSGGDFALFRVSLQCDAGLFVERNPKGLGFDRAGDHVVRHSLAPQKVDPSLGMLVAAARPDERGTVTFRALQPGQEIVLRVTGLTGKPVHYERTLEPLGESERRSVVVALGETWKPFRGVVVDPAKHPIVGAFVKLNEGCRVQTDERGEFVLSCPEPYGTLRASHPGFATLEIEDFVVPEDGSAIELVMQPGRRVVITVVDERGEPVPEAEVSVSSKLTSAPAIPLGEGRFESNTRAHEPFQISTRVCGRFFEQLHDSDSDEARVVVPALGTVIVEWSRPLEHAGGGWVLFTLRGTTPKSRDIVPLPLRATGQTSCTIRRVLPGTWELTCVYSPSDEERGHGAQDEPLASPIVLTVEPGAETRVTFPGR